MNLFKRNRAGTTLPAEIAPAELGNQLRAGSNAALARATDIYRKNPKMVGGLAILAGALLLNRMKAR